MAKPPKLTPATPAVIKEFERRRESDAVIHSKCETCGAWYETDRRATPFRETFFCDCGAEMAFDVPALTGRHPLIPATNEAAVALLGDDARLDTGMKVQEAKKRAAEWWDTKGCQLMQRELARQSKTVGGSDNGAGGSFASRDMSDPNFLPSGLIHGIPWAALGKRERLMVIKVWHHFNVRKPDILGESPDQQHKFQDRQRIH